METTTVPTWAVYLVSIGTLVLAFLGVLLASWLTRRTAKELESRSRREEVMRTLRWAAELAAAKEPGLAQLGVAELAALSRSNLLDDDQKVFIDAALETVVDEQAERIDQLEATGSEVEIIEDLDR